MQYDPIDTVYSIGSDLENLQTSDFPLPGWILSQVFACHMSSVILPDIIQTVLETSECFLSESTNYMHIVAFGPE